MNAIFDNGTVRLVTIDDTRTSFIVNGHCLRLYHRLTSKDRFFKQLFEKSSLKVISVENISSAPFYIYDNNNNNKEFCSIFLYFCRSYD